MTTIVVRLVRPDEGAAHVAVHALDDGCMDIPAGGEAMASRLAMLALIDALSIGLVLGNPTRASEALDAVDEVAAKHQA